MLSYYCYHVFQNSYDFFFFKGEIDMFAQQFKE